MQMFFGTLKPYIHKKKNIDFYFKILINYVPNTDKKNRNDEKYMLETSKKIYYLLDQTVIYLINLIDSSFFV
jgi:hypothetical protein